MGNACLGSKAADAVVAEKSSLEYSTREQLVSNDISQMFKVCRTGDFKENESKLVHCRGREVVVWKRQGEFYSLDNGCYHHGAALLNGDIEEMGGKLCVICPWHGYRITLERGEGLYWGLDTNLKNRSIKSKGIKQRAHRVVISEEDVYVDVNVDPEPLDSDHYSCSGNVVDKGGAQGVKPSIAIRLIKREPACPSGLSIKYTFKFTDAGTSSIISNPGEAALIKISALETERWWTVVATVENGFSIIVKKKESGIVSNWLASEIKPGQCLAISETVEGFGFTAIPPPVGLDLILVAGGIGITPMIAILNHCFDSSEPQIGSVHLFYSEKTQADHVLTNLLEQYSQHFPQQFFLHAYVTQSAPEYDGPKGRITPADILEHCPTPRHTYVCGPGVFFESVKSGLVAGGYPQALIHKESFDS